MSTLVIPQGYKAPLPNYELQRAIAFIKESFQTNLSNALNLRRVSAPLFVASDSGLNDNLNGTERPVRFDIPGVGGKDAEVVHSLAKWKRLALKRYGFHEGKGLYTDMNAIRRDEDDLDNIHSVYVDQWDWEKVIREEDRNEAYLKNVVRSIVSAVHISHRQIIHATEEIVVGEAHRVCEVLALSGGLRYLSGYQLLQLSVFFKRNRRALVGSEHFAVELIGLRRGFPDKPVDLCGGTAVYLGYFRGDFVRGKSQAPRSVHLVFSRVGYLCALCDSSGYVPQNKLRQFGI